MEQTLRWSLFGLLWLLILASLGALFAGGLIGVAAWLAIQTLIPGVSVLFLVGTLVYAAVRRRMSAPIIATAVTAPSGSLADYGCWGIEVVAPIGGRVSAARDGLADAVPGVLSGDYSTPTGNFVSIETEHGTHLILAHLQKDSVVVEEGHVVVEGEPLGRCGNSGNTSEPHIHIHHQRQSPKDFPTGFAEGLPLFFRDHDGPAMPLGGVELSGDEYVPIGDRVLHRGASEEAAR